MQQSRNLISLAMAAMLALALALPALADPPPAPWIAKDIGEPSAAGSTDVDANGVWTIRGDGDDIFNVADNFQFAYQVVRGDASISARFLSMEIVEPSWTKVGLMVRENDTAGSPNVNYCMTSGNGLHATVRTVQDEATASLGQVGPTTQLEANVYMRLQRVGNEVAGFWSRDGVLWTQAGFAPQTLPTLKEEALIGLTVTSHSDGEIAVGRMDRVSLQPGVVSPYGIGSCGGDRSVLLQWRPLPNALGFNIYRGPAGATRDQLVKLNTDPVVGASYTDMAEGLTNGTPMTYAVAAVFRGADGNPVEGQLVAAQGTPVAAPPGFIGCSINEGARSGAVLFDAATGEITIRGSGADIWGTADGFYFVSQPVEGDVQVTVRALTKPTHTHDWAKAGIMIRESLEPGARHAMLVLTPANGLAFQWRMQRNDISEWPGSAAIDSDSLLPPLVLRLTRRGNTITPEYSTDNGQTFQSAGDPVTFETALPRTVHVGLAITAHTTAQVSEAKFSNLEIRKL